MKQIAPDIRSHLAKTTTFEVMSTVSACRTFNIVAGEGRKVLLAVIVES
jgi:uncharacterized protein